MVSVRSLILCSSILAGMTGAGAFAGYLPFPLADTDAPAALQPDALAPADTAAVTAAPQPDAPAYVEEAATTEPQQASALASAPIEEASPPGEPSPPALFPPEGSVRRDAAPGRPVVRSQRVYVSLGQPALAQKLVDSSSTSADPPVSPTTKSEGESMKPATCLNIVGCGVMSAVLAVAPITAHATQDQALGTQDVTTDLANAIAAALNSDAVAAAVASFSAGNGLSPEDVAQAFGAAMFLCDLGRCKNPQAIADSFAAYKKGKDGQALDAAFAMGRVGAEADGGTASAEVYQSSFAALGTAGDAPSGQ